MSNGKKSGLLQGHVALVSGGAQGIGRAIAACFSREGACVALLDCDAAAGTRAAHEIGSGAANSCVQFVHSDLSDPAQITSAGSWVRERYGRLDILINNAGIEADTPLAALSVSEWDRIMNVNLRGAFLLSQAVAPLFPESGGSIINISSIHASQAFPNSIPYACSKAGMLALTRNLALELAPRKIRVNSICPGYIDTRLWEEYLRNSTDPDALAAHTAALHPLGRRGIPEDVGEAALFLASKKSSFITGTSLVVDGGITIRAHL